MWVRFWGVRGSCPAPINSDDVTARLVEAVCRFGKDEAAPDPDDRVAMQRWVAKLPPSVRGIVGSNSPCVEMRTSHGDIVIIDFGTGIRSLGNELAGACFKDGQGHAHLFLSHYHWDHIQGWPFFRPAYIRGNRLDLYARHADLERHLRQQQDAPYFPPASWADMMADINYHQLTERPMSICDGRIRVNSLELDHPSRSFAYRFEADDQVFVYASDAAYNQLDHAALRPYVEFYQDADLLLFDAQFTLTESFEKRTWGHSSAIVGVELACQAGVRHLSLFHHDPAADDATLDQLLEVARQYAAMVPCELRRNAHQCTLSLAREGETIYL